MTHQPSPEPPQSSARSPLQPASTGSLPADAPRRGDYRDELRSRRWDAAPLRNPEVQKTDPRIAVAFIVVLCVVTLVVLVAGYASGFWSLPGEAGASGAVTALELLA
jgi:hypothetical protein